MVSRPAETAVSASISTPVWPRVLTVTAMATAERAWSTSNSTETPVSRSGWHIGISSQVRLAAITAATWATARTSPFLMPPLWIAARVAGCIRISPAAVATRSVTSLSPTSTMRGRPAASRWVRSAISRQDGRGSREPKADRRQLLVEADDPPGGRGPGEARHRGAGGAADAGGQLGVVEEVLDPAGELGWRAPGHQQAVLAVAHERGQAADPRGDQRGATGQRLERDQP